MWQGIPFKLINTQCLDALNIIIKNVPGVVTPATTDFYGPILTGLATLVGGALPALIAFKAIKANKEQMLHQQIIISKQQFIDNLRLKLSAFSAQMGRLDVYINQQVQYKGLTVRSAPEEIRDKIARLAYELDLEYNHIELMVGDIQRFEKLLNLMREITDQYLEKFEGKSTIDVFEQMELITQEAIRCISDEWKQTIDNFH